MKDFTQTFNNKAASTEDFKAIIEKHMTPLMDAEHTRTMDWFFRQYVYGIGIPTYELNYNVEQVGDKYHVSGKVIQSKVPAGWKDILVLYLHAGGKTMRIGSVRADGPESAVEFTLAVRPDKISLNDQEDTLADIKR